MKREELKRARRKSNLLLVCILLLQLGMLLFWGNAKTNYYVDELFSMGYAHNFTGAAGDAQYIHTDDSWVINAWVPVTELKEQLVVGEGESVLDIPASQAIRLTVTGRNHHGLLNLAETLLNDGEISKRGGLFLNYLAFLLFQLVLILFLRRLEVDERLVCAAVLLTGFCGLLAGLAQFIRFYMLTCFYVLLILHLHLILWQTGKAVPFLAAEAGAGLLFLLAFKNSELTLIVSGALIVFFTLGLLFTKQWKKAACYAVPVFSAGLWYVCRKTVFMDMVLHPSAFLTADESKRWVSEGVLSATPAKMAYYFIEDILPAMGRELFGCVPVMAVMLGAVVVLVLLGLRSKNGGRPGKTFGFMLILLLVLLTYGLFLLLARLQAQQFVSRYYSYAFLLVIPLFWYAADRAVKRLPAEGRVRRAAPILLCMLALTAAVWTQAGGNIEYIYREEAGEIAALQEYSALDSVVESDDAFCNYDCVYLAAAGTKIMPAELGLRHMPEELPDRFLYWRPAWHKGKGGLKRLDRRGYRVTLAASTHASLVYVCEREK